LKFVAVKVYNDFVDLFVGTFSRKQNAEFLKYASHALKKQQWKQLSQCFRRAASLGLAKCESDGDATESVSLQHKAWTEFRDDAERFEQQRLTADAGMAFVFAEGALVDAVRTGKWILLDEVNLASSENLMRICGLLDGVSGSLTLTERGDSSAIVRHPEFRLFAAMNPATDSGKKDLNPTIRSRFTEFYVGEILDPRELRSISVQYLSDVLQRTEVPSRSCETVIAIVDVYLKLRELAESTLVDGSGQRPRYTLRTFTRAMTAARTFTKEQKLSLKRALYEGFELAFAGPLDGTSTKAMRKVLRVGIGLDATADEMDHPGRRPGKENDYSLVSPFWLKKGALDCIDWSTAAALQHRKFVLTPATKINLRRLSRAVAAGPWPILLEGPTSAGYVSNSTECCFVYSWLTPRVHVL
jgi:midasin